MEVMRLSKSGEVRGNLLFTAPPAGPVRAVLNQVNPGDGTIYEVLPEVRNVRLINAQIRCTWTLQPTPLELHAVIDGVTWNWSQGNPVSNTSYYPVITPELDVDAQWLNATLYGYYRASLLDARSLSISAEISGGTVQNLDCWVYYALYGG